MKSQTYSNWEWIIINDGSEDNSDNVIAKLILQYFPQSDNVRYLKQPNSGKHVAWNRAVLLANGDFFIPADCDDAFVPETLDFFNYKANDLCKDDFCKSNFSGISACCFDPSNNCIIGSPYPKDGIISNDIELSYKYHVSGEKWGCIRTDLLKERPFPNIKGHFYNENYLWFSFPLSGYKKANYNKMLRAYYVESNSIVHNKNSRYDSQKAIMQIKYKLWEIFKVGKLIFRYSYKDYLLLYVYLFRACIKLILSILHGK